jgi:Domain of unknown function (DUF3597)
MGIFGNIMSAIFGGHASAQSALGNAPASNQAAGTAQSPPLAPGGSASGTASAGSVDVNAVLTERAAKKKEKLDWRHSIVDLMKVLDLDSSLSARKELAQELHYTGDTNDSASMNIWLHKQVMKKLAENGGKVPADLMR